MVVEAAGGAHHEHHEHARGAPGSLQRRLGDSLKASDLQRNVKGPNESEMEPQLC